MGLDYNMQNSDILVKMLKMCATLPFPTLTGDCMTRINVVPVQELSRQHLLSEYRELPRVFALARNAQYSNFDRKQPIEYTLGTGHVLFFYNKLGYIQKRHKQLVDEMHSRGYTCNFDDVVALSDGIQSYMFGDYVPTEKALTINRERIALRTYEANVKRLSKSSK